ncbi:MAG: hypothetical protein KW806_03115 [Candidatus Yanofskybacteria bacterium]|nr:hypothetical protein [Candidatus Yanofskybacteria bacterium]
MWLLLRDKKFLHATALLVGTMVGVGIFGIPFVFAKAGFFVGLGFLVLMGAVTWLANIMFAEVVLRTHAPHQLVGYASRYVGLTGKRLMLLTNTLGIYGALLAYLIISGQFLNNIFSSFAYVRPEVLSTIFWVFVSSIAFLKFKTAAGIEFTLTGLFLGVVALMFMVGIFKIDFHNYLTVTPQYWFLPYGVLLFALGGITTIPIQRELLGDKEHHLKRSITLAVILVTILYLMFAFTVVGISGDATSPDALSGLFDYLGTSVIVVGSLFGVLAITTSYLMLSKALRDIFYLDYGLANKWSWLLVVVPPFVLFMSGFRAFIDTIELVGAVAIGLEYLVILFLFVKAKREGDRVPEFSFPVPTALLYILAVAFSLGVIYALIV